MATRGRAAAFIAASVDSASSPRTTSIDDDDGSCITWSSSVRSTANPVLGSPECAGPKACISSSAGDPAFPMLVGGSGRVSPIDNASLNDIHMDVDIVGPVGKRTMTPSVDNGCSSGSSSDKTGATRYSSSLPVLLRSSDTSVGMYGVDVSVCLIVLLQFLLIKFACIYF